MKDSGRGKEISASLMPGRPQQLYYEALSTPQNDFSTLYGNTEDTRLHQAGRELLADSPADMLHRYYSFGPNDLRLQRTGPW